MSSLDDPRIKPEHLERRAIVYLRQSSPGQVRQNVESTQLQLGLRERAIALGWIDPIVIQDDLGITASGFAERPGFQRMLTDVSMKKVGIIFAINACRLSRNSTDWANLFEVCGHFNTLVSDLDKVYDLSQPDDRLLLGIKGTIAEMELSILKLRLRSGIEAKAARGELKTIVPPGYSHDHNHHIIFDPNRRVREAIKNMFEQFDRCSSVRQLAHWYKDTETLFPTRKVRRTRTIEWEIPTISNLYKLLVHPIYAGVYTYGRRQLQVDYVDGKLIKRYGPVLPPEQCRVCRFNNHPGYISWDKYLANQDKISEARPRWSMQQNRGAIRDGLALLSGLLRCGHCGRKIYVNYKKNSALYFCTGGSDKGSRQCLSFGSKLIDQRVGDELSQALQPIAIEASQLVFKRRCEEQDQAIRQAELQLEEAQYQADRAFEQYDCHDPKNRLVVDSLEKRLNDRLLDLQNAKQHLEECKKAFEPIPESQLQKIETLSSDFSAVWNHPKASAALRKRLFRTAIEEIIVKHETESQSLLVTIHWKGGVHTQIHVKKRATPVGSKANEDLVELVRKLADSLGDAEIARVLNMQKKTTPRSLSWTQDRVHEFRKHHKIRLGNRKPDPDLLTSQQAAQYLGISRNGINGLIRIGLVRKQQVTDFAPWHISRRELDSEPVQQAVRVLKTTGRLPKQGVCPEQQNLLSPMISGKG